jgi:predicted HTH domain antitoxin
MTTPIEDSKKELEFIKAKGNIDIESIFDIVKQSSNEMTSTKRNSKDHITINTLDKIKEALSAKKIQKDERGIEQLVPVYQEEEKVKIIFGMLAEKGLNLIDNLEKILERDGYRYAIGGDGGFEEGSNKLIEKLNETFSNTTNVLRDISEFQYKKSKLELEKENLRIQDYKAKLKEKELMIKEKRYSNEKPTTTNVLAVGSQAELIQLLKSQKEEIDGPKEIDASVSEK